VYEATTRPSPIAESATRIPVLSDRLRDGAGTASKARDKRAGIRAVTSARELREERRRRGEGVVRVEDEDLASKAGHEGEFRDGSERGFGTNASPGRRMAEDWLLSRRRGGDVVGTGTGIGTGTASGGSTPSEVSLGIGRSPVFL